MIACPPPELVALIDDATHDPKLWPVVCDWLGDHRMDDLAKELAEVVRLGRLPQKWTIMPGGGGWRVISSPGDAHRQDGYLPHTGYGWVVCEGYPSTIRPAVDYLSILGKLTFAVAPDGSAAYLYPTMAEAVLAIAQAQHDYDNPPW